MPRGTPQGSPRGKTNATCERGGSQVASAKTTTSIPQRRAPRRASSPAGGPTGSADGGATSGADDVTTNSTASATQPRQPRAPKKTRKVATHDLTQVALSPEFAPPAPPPYQPAFTPSAYQAAIFDFVAHGRGDGLIDAKAGAGKTSTLVECARIVTDREALFLAFNTHIADELTRRLAGTNTVAKTIHKVGYACVARHLRGGLRPVDEDKYKHLAYDLVSRTVARLQQREHTLETQRRGLRAQAAADYAMSHDTDSELERVRADLEIWQLQRHAIATTLADYAHYARVTLTDPRDLAALDALDDHYHIVESLDLPYLPPLVAPLIDAGLEAATHDKHIDFDDMLYLPHVWNLHPTQAAQVYIDEAQDLSAAQLALALKCRAPGGRVLACGDPHQAIYGFAGADSESFWNIQRATHATLLPLSICYRCPTSHLTLAQEIVPEIEARPEAPEGIVGSIQEQQLAQELRGGDLILCRVTAPLVALCIRLIGQRVPARVRGRDIGKGISNLIKQIQAHPAYRTYADLLATLDTYEDEQTAILSRRKNGAARVAALHDRLEALRICYEQFPARDADSLRAQIDALFSDKEQLVTLSTVHRAKGLEAERVFIVRRDKMPLTWVGQQPWELAQELNITYVAYTRAKRELWFVEEGSSAS